MAICRRCSDEYGDGPDTDSIGGGCDGVVQSIGDGGAMKTLISTGWQKTPEGWRKADIYMVKSGRIAVKIFTGNEGAELTVWCSPSPRYYRRPESVYDALEKHTCQAISIFRMCIRCSANTFGGKS